MNLKKKDILSCIIRFTKPKYSQHSLFDVFELFIFMWFCEVWVMGQQVDHIGNDILRKEGDKFFWGERITHFNVDKCVSIRLYAHYQFAKKKVGTSKYRKKLFTLGWDRSLCIDRNKMPHSAMETDLANKSWHMKRAPLKKRKLATDENIWSVWNDEETVTSLN